MTDRDLTHEEMLEIAAQRERENEEANKPKSLGTSLEQWWDSEAHKQLQEASEASVQRALEKYSMLSEDDKYDMVQAICFILYNAEQSRTSHRGLMDALGIYPSGFWISELMTIHNSLWEYFHNKRQEKDFKDDLDILEDVMNNKDNK